VAALTNIIYVTVDQCGKRRYNFEANVEVYDGSWVNNSRQGFGKSTRAYAGEAA
jgi:hypothetical protein